MLSHQPYLKEMPRDYLEAAYEQQIRINDCLRLGYTKVHSAPGFGFDSPPFIVNELEYLKYHNKAYKQMIRKQTKEL